MDVKSLFYDESFGFCLGGGSFKVILNQGQIESKTNI